MADYSVGNLFLDISAIENGSIKTLSTVTRSLNSLYKSVDKISKLNTKDFYTKLNSISRILTPLKDLGSSFKSAGAINTFANGLQKITKLDVAGFDKQLKSLTVSLRPFLQEITKSTPALNAFASAMNAVKGRRTIGFKQLNQFVGGGNNLAKSLNLAGIVGKIYFIRNYTKQLGQSISKIVQMGMDFTETLNLWTVAMGNNIASAEEFISKMNKAYGIAEETLMRYQATFRNMLSTLGGVSTDTSYALSEYIMQMALDYASLYNTSIEKAMTVFQAVLSGQVRPIRSISGYDITETTIYELYQQLGGTKTMRQLTQTEKRLLRIYAVFQQMERSGAVGDLAKTLNSTANTTRVLSETLKSLGTYIGVLLDQYLSPLLTKVTAFAITVTNIIKAIAQPIIDKKKEELGDYGLAWEETTDGINGASEAYDEFTGKLLGFDKFRSLSSSEEETNVGIDEKLLNGLMQYQSILDKVNSTAQDYAKNWTSIFVDEEGELTAFGYTLLGIIGAVGVGLASWGVGTIVSAFGKLPKIFKSISKYAFKISAVLGVSILGFSLANDVAENTENQLTKITAYINAGLMAVGAVLAFFGVNIPLGITLMAIGAGNLFAQKALNSEKLPQSIKEMLLMISTALGMSLLAVGAMIAFSGINIGLGIGLMVAGASTLASIVAPNWNSMSTEIKNAISLIMTILGSAFLVIGALFAFSGVSIPVGIALMALGVGSLVTAVSLNWDIVTNAMQGTVGKLMAIIGGALMVIGLILLFTGVGTGLGLGLLLGGAASLGTAIAFNWDYILEAIQKIWGKITDFWDKYISPVFTAKFWKNIGVGIINGIVWFLNGIINVFEDTINFFAEIGDVILSVFGIDVGRVSLPRIPKLSYFAEGGMPDKGTLFVAGEAGAEMVYNTPNGQSGVANVQQIAQASYSGTKQALVDWWKSAQSDIPSFREVSKTGIYEVVDGEARRRGRVLGTV